MRVSNTLLGSAWMVSWRVGPAAPPDAMKGASRQATVAGAATTVNAASAPRPAAAIVSAACSARRSRSSAMGRKRRPAALRVSAPGRRVNSGTPKSFSNALSCREREGWAMWTRRDAAVTEPVSATARK